ncbi:uncharacterized protein UMAG_03196 [Mycosarcoma maydis]|uniref:Uncharacterized protein n=1 Tax=Mycosarcoma maydis TaxID=5270 RepID=A0A0D1E229_MYCMD|nr:uncharacterized protein UMAG_03196 [Ustilago maydis 521]KIS68620.1 hypothetical protein UMAG_03196 [Ustilago maydis 521]|eukprot:XP_011389637.1 hypothetical protein UMAG_03196 [Ustilago maydis 521]
MGVSFRCSARFSRSNLKIDQDIHDYSYSLGTLVTGALFARRADPYRICRFRLLDFNSRAHTVTDGTQSLADSRWTEIVFTTELHDDQHTCASPHKSGNPQTVTAQASAQPWDARRVPDHQPTGQSFC